MMNLTNQIPKNLFLLGMNYRLFTKILILIFMESIYVKTRECMVDPPYIWVSFDVKNDPLNLEKKKLPPGWHRKKKYRKE